MTAYKSNQIHSPLFLKETIITFLSIVISLRAPVFHMNTVFLVQKRDQNDTILLYGIIPLIVNYRMAGVINNQRHNQSNKIGHAEMIREHHRDAKSLLGVVIRNLNTGIRQLESGKSDHASSKQTSFQNLAVFKWE